MTDPPVEPDTRLVETAQSLKGSRALDVGCGTGENALWLADNGWTVTAIDVSATAVDMTRKKAIEWAVPLTTIRIDGREFFSEEPFDLINVCYLHLREPIRKRLLKNLVGLLEENGVLLWRSFEADTEDPGYAANLLPTSNDIVDSLGKGIEIHHAKAEDEFFPYLNREMRLLTVKAENTMILD